MEGTRARAGARKRATAPKSMTEIDPTPIIAAAGMLAFYMPSAVPVMIYALFGLGFVA